jgi:hypothetical protein
VEIDADVVRIARAATREAMKAGARAVVLAGSHVRGDANVHSDIDLIAILPKAIEPHERPRALRPYRMREDHLVSLACETSASVRAAFRSPERATTFVPGWREAIILADPHGIASRLKRAAERWSWEDITDEADRYVAASITGLAEEVHKMAGMSYTGNVHAAAAQRSILAVWLAGVMAVRHRILFGTDNVLWERVGERMGPRWRRAQAAALCEGGESFEESSGAALYLYGLAACDALPLLDRDQHQVVAEACAAFGKILKPLRAAGRGSRGSR